MTDRPRTDAVILRLTPGPFESYERRHAEHALTEIAILCEIAGISHARKRDLHNPYGAALTRLLQTNRTHMPAAPLDRERLAILAAAPALHLFDADFTAAEAGPRLDMSAPDAQAIIIDRVLRDCSAFIAPALDWLNTDNNIRFGHYMAANTPELFLGPHGELAELIDGDALFTRINAALTENGLSPLPSPYHKPPPRTDHPVLKPL